MVKLLLPSSPCAQYLSMAFSCVYYMHDFQHLAAIQLCIQFCLYIGCTDPVSDGSAVHSCSIDSRILQDHVSHILLKFEQNVSEKSLHDEHGKFYGAKV